MPIEVFRSIPTNLREWSNYLSQTRVTPSNESVDNEQFANRSALSVIGRAGDTAGQPADIVAGANNQFLVRRSSVLGFGPLVDADIPSTIARDTEVTAAAGSAQSAAESTAAAALSAHVAAADPHTGYRRESVDVPWTEVSGKPAALGMLYSGTGDPDGVVAAAVGSLFLRTDGGTGTSLYVKETGAATSSGWVAK